MTFKMHQTVTNGVIRDNLLLNIAFDWLMWLEKYIQILFIVDMLFGK